MVSLGTILAVTKCPAHELDKMRQNLEKIFGDNGLKITTLHNIKRCDFLDVHLNLENGTTRPFKKKNDVLQYINCLSNHPPMVLKSVPKTVQTRLSMLSSSKAIFEEEKKIYEEALKKMATRRSCNTIHMWQRKWAEKEKQK